MTTSRFERGATVWIANPYGDPFEGEIISDDGGPDVEVRSGPRRNIVVIMSRVLVSRRELREEAP